MCLTEALAIPLEWDKDQGSYYVNVRELPEGSDLAKTPLLTSPKAMLTMINGAALPRGPEHQDQVYGELAAVDFSTTEGAKLTFSPVSWASTSGGGHGGPNPAQSGLARDSLLVKDRSSTTKGKVDRTLKWEHRGGSTTLTVSNTSTISIPLLWDEVRSMFFVGDISSLPSLQKTPLCEGPDGRVAQRNVLTQINGTNLGMLGYHMVRNMLEQLNFNAKVGMGGHGWGLRGRGSGGAWVGLAWGLSGGWAALGRGLGWVLAALSEVFRARARGVALVGAPHPPLTHRPLHISSLHPTQLYSKDGVDLTFAPVRLDAAAVPELLASASSVEVVNCRNGPAGGGKTGRKATRFMTSKPFEMIPLMT